MRTFEEIRKDGDLLFETVRGSTLFGLNLPSSDVDTFGLFIAKPEELYGTRLRYSPMVASEKNDDTWDELEKFIKELGKSNPNALEALFTPQKFILTKNPIIDPLLEIRDSLITQQCFLSFRGYAKSQISKMSGLSKAMNIDPAEVKVRKSPLEFSWVPRPCNDGVWNLEKWLREMKLKQEHCGVTRLPNGNNLFTLYYDWFADKTLDPEVYAKLRYNSVLTPEIEEELREGKKTQMIKYRGIIHKSQDTTQIRLSSIPKEDAVCPLCSFQYNEQAFSQHCSRYKAYWSWVEKRNPVRYSENVGHNYDAKNSCHALRLLRMGKEIAQGQGFLLDRTNIDRDELLKMKTHRYSFEEARDLLLRAEEEMLEAFKNSNLPEEPDKELLEDILIEIRRKHYTL